MVFGFQYDAKKFISNAFQMVTIPDADMGSRSAEAGLSVGGDGGSIGGHPISPRMGLGEVQVASWRADNSLPATGPVWGGGVHRRVPGPLFGRTVCRAT